MFVICASRLHIRNSEPTFQFMTSSDNGVSETLNWKQSSRIRTYPTLLNLWPKYLFLFLIFNNHSNHLFQIRTDVWKLLGMKIFVQQSSIFVLNTRTNFLVRGSKRSNLRVCRNHSQFGDPRTTLILSAHVYLYLFIYDEKVVKFLFA